MKPSDMRVGCGLSVGERVVGGRGGEAPWMWPEAQGSLGAASGAVRTCPLDTENRHRSAFRSADTKGLWAL